MSQSVADHYSILICFSRFIFGTRTSPLTIHGLGAAISKAVDISNSLVQMHSGTLVASVVTSTIPLVDDYEPLVPDLPPISQIRLTSAIHITLTPTALSSKAAK